jgi:hypothetical protein
VTDQIVRVAIGGDSKELTYRWVGEGELVVGDIVVVPPPPWVDTSEMRERYSRGVVTGIGSNYTGHMVSISQRGSDA